MKFKVWLLSRKAKRIVLHIYHNHYIVWLRNTLLYNILKMFLLVVVLLGIIFRIAPQIAHISFTTNENEIASLGSIIADRVTMNLTTNRVSVSCNDDIELYCLGNGDIIVDDVIYDKSYTLIFEPYSKELGGEIFISQIDSKDIQIEMSSF